MSGCSGSDFCLVLSNAEDLLGVVGVGVLLRSYPSASADASSEMSFENIPTYRASIVFVSQCIAQDSDVRKAVRLTQYQQLRPSRVRFLGLGLGQNLMSKAGQWLNERLSNSWINCSPVSSSDNQNLSTIEFEVWCLNDYQQEYKSKSSKMEETCSVSFDYNKKCECSYIEIFDTLDEQDEIFLWEIAGFLVKKIAQKNRISLKHFGFLVSVCETEQKKVKDAIEKYILYEKNRSKKTNKKSSENNNYES